jgi:hypothetical protein
MSENKKLTFSKYFEVDKKILKQEGFFDISLISDLPLFIDPFHLFYSENEDYQRLHEEIINYLSFLREVSVTSAGGGLSSGVINAYYRFPEIKQNWLGFSVTGNAGRGLGKKFAITLDKNFYNFFRDFGGTNDSQHLEKLTLIAKGVGKDTISDFTTNLIHSFLASKTEAFSNSYINPEKTAKFTIKKAAFDYKRKAWIPKVFNLPTVDGDYVLLTPRDLLTGNNTWINKKDLEENFLGIPQAAPNDELRELLSNYFNQKLAEYAGVKKDKKTGKEIPSITKKTRVKAARDTIVAYPQAINIYIKIKERDGAKAKVNSEIIITETETLFKNQFSKFVQGIELGLAKPSSHDEAYKRAIYFKECIELHDNYLNLYNGDKPMDEEWIQRMFWFVWFGSESDLNRAPKNGLGEPDFVASQGRKDKTLVEFKLAKSSSLENNLLEQLKKYKEVNQTEKGIWVIIFFSEGEERRVKGILKKHKLDNDKNYILVDARKDNKIPPSKIKHG